MSRSGYSDSCEAWDLIRWRGAVASAIRGRRGQTFLQELVQALDAVPGKALIANSLQAEKPGDVCALGSIGLARKMDLEAIDPEDREQVAHAFGIPLALACEIMYLNDEGSWRETPEERWSRMRKWAEKELKANAGT